MRRRRGGPCRDGVVGHGGRGGRRGRLDQLRLEGLGEGCRLFPGSRGSTECYVGGWQGPVGDPGYSIGLGGGREVDRNRGESKVGEVCLECLSPIWYLRRPSQHGLPPPPRPPGWGTNLTSGRASRCSGCDRGHSSETPHHLLAI